MIQVLTAVKDEKAGTFGEIKACPTCQVAIRGFANAVQENKFIMKNAEDFNLYFVGQWDNETGKLAIAEPNIIAKATEFTIEETKKENK